MLRFTCEKALLQAAAATASRAVSAKSSIPALEGLLLEADDVLKLSGYNTQIGIRTTVEADISQPGRIVLNARLFGDIIRRMPDDVIVFSADEKLMVRLTCGDASFEILGLSADDYPELPEVDDQYAVALQQRMLKAMIGQTAFAVSTNESRPIHTGALFEIDDSGLTMVAVDGFRLALRREPLEKIEGGEFRFVAPGSALKEVESICGDTDDMIRVTCGKRHILFSAGNTQLICRRLEGDFLDYRNAIPRQNPIRIEVGMGKGQFILEQASRNPDVNFVGIEKYSTVLLKAIRKREQMELSNIYFLCEDARELAEIFGPGEVERIYLNFSDPWPKDRHARRRLTSPPFMAVYDQILQKDGRVEFKTDNQDLFSYSLEAIPEAGWRITEYTRDLHHSEMAEGNVMTEYEAKFSAQGKPICKLVAVR